MTAPGLAVPYAVSVISKIRSPPGNVLLVRNTDDDTDLINTTNFNMIPEKIGICVKPLHFDYDSVSKQQPAISKCTYFITSFKSSFGFYDIAGFISFGILRDEHTFGNITFYILQSYAGTACLLCTTPLYERQFYAEFPFKYVFECK